MRKCTSTRGGEPTGPDWPRAGKGILLVGIACFLFLNSLGRLPWSFWLDAIALWPLLIISAGIHIAFEKSRAAWLVLFGPLGILAGLAWLATGARPGLPSGPWEPVAAARPEAAESLELDATLVGARLWLQATGDMRPDQLVAGRSLRLNQNARLETETDGRTARAHVNGGRRGGTFFFLPRPREHWDLRVPAELPLRVHVRGAGVGGRLDLTGAALETARGEGVFIGFDLRLPAPRRDTEIRMNGVFNSLTVTVPEGTPVKVHGTGLPFNVIDRGVAGAEGRPGYQVRLEGIFCAVDVLTDPAIRPEPLPEPAAPSPAAPPSPSPSS